MAGNGRLGEIRRRFVSFSGEYAARLGSRSPYIILKRDHSLRVHALASSIVKGEGLPCPDLHCLAALVHDIGRFSQFERFGTYRDDLSVDHGDEGAAFLRSGDFLRGVEVLEQKCVMDAVRLHNKRVLPDGLNALTMSLCAVVRDADKLDIVPVVLSRMLPGGERDEVVTLGLRDEPQSWSPGVVATVAAGACPAYADLLYINDFKLLLASWGPQLSFTTSRAIFARRGYLARLFELLPENPRFHSLHMELDRRLHAES